MLHSKNIIIFKNDAVGDLSQSLNAINNIINHNKNNNITIYLSERSKDFSFFFNFNNVRIKIVKYDLTIVQKIKIFLFLTTNSIDSIYIFTPKNCIITIFRASPVAPNSSPNKSEGAIIK